MADTSSTRGCGTKVGLNVQRIVTWNDGSGGNVGIGTTAPIKPLQVSSANTNDTSIDLNNTSASGRQWEIASMGSTSGQVGNLLFYDVTAAAGRMVINPSGNVGIGTIAPVDKLDVIGKAAAISSSGAIWDHVATWADSLYGYIDVGNANSLRMRINSGTTDGPNTAAYNDIMTLTPSGNVGIGTTTPRSSLSVAGNNGDASDQLALYQLANNIFSIQTLLDGKTTADYPYGGGNNALALQPLAGFVGIGTTTPGAKLDISGGGESIRLSGGASQTFMTFLNGATRKGYVGTGAGGNDMIVNVDSGSIVLQGGNVGNVRKASPANSPSERWPYSAECRV